MTLNFYSMCLTTQNFMSNGKKKFVFEYVRTQRELEREFAKNAPGAMQICT